MTTATEDYRTVDTEAQKRLKQAQDVAREEAEQRRERNAARERTRAAMPPEIDGRGGEEPTRYGDWEVKGLASDF